MAGKPSRPEAPSDPGPESLPRGPCGLAGAPRFLPSASSAPRRGWERSASGSCGPRLCFNDNSPITAEVAGRKGGHWATQRTHSRARGSETDRQTDNEAQSEKPKPQSPWRTPLRGTPRKGRRRRGNSLWSSPERPHLEPHSPAQRSGPLSLRRPATGRPERSCAPLVGSASLCREVLLLQLPHLPVWLATSRPFAGSPLGGRNAGGTETMKPERRPRGLASRLPPECLVTSCGAPGHLCGSHLPSGAQTAYSAQEGGFPDQTLMKDEEPRWFL